MEDRLVVAHNCRKTNKIICGMEGENVVAYGRLPFLARPTPSIRELGTWLYVPNYTRRILKPTPVVSENLEHGPMYPIIPGESRTRLLWYQRTWNMALCTQFYPENLESDSCSISELGTWLYVYNYTRRILNPTTVVYQRTLNMALCTLYPENLEPESCYSIRELRTWLYVPFILKESWTQFNIFIPEKLLTPFFFTYTQ